MALNIDFKKISQRVVRDCLCIKPGERLMINCGEHSYYNFCEELAQRTVEAGAYPLVTFKTGRLVSESLLKPDEYIKSPPDFTLHILNEIDAMIMVAFPEDPNLLANIPPEKLAAGGASSKAFYEFCEKRNREKTTLRLASFLFPTKPAAERFGLSFDEYHDIVWSAIDIDYPAMGKRAKKIASALEGKDKIKITCPGGSNLELSIKGRRILLDDGEYSQEDIDSGVWMMNLPAGEVAMAPVEDSANGIAFFSYNMMHGKVLKNLRLTFKAGKIVQVEADEGAEYFENVMRHHSGASDSIAELGIGINPGVTKVTGETALDEKIAGTIHIATGDNTMLCGSQKSSFHHDNVMQKPTVEIEGVKIMDNGEYII